MGQHLLFDVRYDICQLRYHSLSSSSQPFEVAASEVKILQGITHRVDFFEAAVACSIEIAHA
jgi:hypothetical protein